MIEFYIKVSKEKEEFFTQLLNNLGYEFEKLFASDEIENEIDVSDDFFTDSDD